MQPTNSQRYMYSEQYTYTSVVNRWREETRTIPLQSYNIHMSDSMRRGGEHLSRTNFSCYKYVCSTYIYSEHKTCIIMTHRRGELYAAICVCPISCKSMCMCKIQGLLSVGNVWGFGKETMREFNLRRTTIMNRCYYIYNAPVVVHHTHNLQPNILKMWKKLLQQELWMFSYMKSSAPLSSLLAMYSQRRKPLMYVVFLNDSFSCKWLYYGLEVYARCYLLKHAIIYWHSGIENIPFCSSDPVHDDGWESWFFSVCVCCFCCCFLCSSNKRFSEKSNSSHRPRVAPEITKPA